MKKNIIFGVFSLMILVGLLVAGLLRFSKQEILIQSLESRTIKDLPVFNRIKYFKVGSKDVWMMNQSHAGLTDEPQKWERLAIVIENKKAGFYQLEPGPLEWTEELLTKQRPYRVSCFICHNNGPRAIRPDGEFNISWSDRVRILFWNLKIKTYGRIQASDQMAIADKIREVPFRHESALDNEGLKVKTCVKCHNNKGMFARGFLKRQQIGTIEFLVKNKLMPPPGFSLDSNEQKQLNDFVMGF